VTIISRDEIRKGDKIKVTWTQYDVEYSRTGVAHLGDHDGDWKTPRGTYLSMVGRQDEVIELLERAKTAEELRKERRDKLAYQFSGDVWNYDGVSRSTRQAIDHIIFLEDVKEAVAN
jgi:hypothetical protein